MYHLLTELGRTVNIVNLDPANENIPYQPHIDVNDLINIHDVMDKTKLGPNGSLLFSMEILEKNVKWLVQSIKQAESEYILFDCPGQIELYTHHCSIRNILTTLEKEFGISLCAVHLVDSHYCSDPHKYISTILLSLNSMLQVSLPHVNLLSKTDQLKRYKTALLFNLDFYTEVLNLEYLLENLDGFDFKKFKKLNHALISVIEDYSLVSFYLLDVNKQESLLFIKNIIDQTNGYVYQTLDSQHS